MRNGMERAAACRFTSEKQVTLFVALQFMLGCDFDSDPQLPSARQVGDQAIKNATARIETVYDAAVDYLTATAGKNCERIVRTLLRIRAYNLPDAPQSSGKDFVNDMLDVLRRFSPEKFEHQGEENRAVIAAARQTAKQYGITANRGALLLAALMFMPGTGIDHDPLHPWARTN
ncbi:MAG: hypothetical protein ACRD9L_25550 [Bryobacteraceae bacterium]